MRRNSCRSGTSSSNELLLEAASSSDTSPRDQRNDVVEGTGKSGSIDVDFDDRIHTLLFPPLGYSNTSSTIRRLLLYSVRELWPIPISPLQPF